MRVRVLSLVVFAGLGAIGSLACSGRTIDKSQGGEVGSGTGGFGGSTIGTGGADNGGPGTGGSGTIGHAGAAGNDGYGGAAGNDGYGGAAGNGGSFAGGGGGGPIKQHPEAGPPLSGDYSVTACPGVTATSMPNAPPCDNICGAAHCVPVSSPGADNPSVPLCDNDGTGAKGKCMPDAIFEVNNEWVAKPCRADITGGASNLDGACIPYCFVSAYVQYLSQKDCGAGELCTPCVDQTTMMPGGACDNRCPNVVVEDSGQEATTTDGSSEPADSGSSDDGGG